MEGMCHAADQGKWLTHFSEVCTARENGLVKKRGVTARPRFLQPARPDGQSLELLVHDGKAAEHFAALPPTSTRRLVHLYRNRRHGRLMWLLGMAPPDK